MRLGALTILLLLVAAAPAGAAFAPQNRPGPKLRVPQAKLAAALTCSVGVQDAARAPVLLLQGTGATAEDNWSWTYQPAFVRLGIPWCAADLPDHATSDIQVAAEYVVYGIRQMAARSGRRVAIVGHSQGGMIGRWALRFWPRTRAKVDDVIGFAPSNHGTTQADCYGGCSAAGWQQRDVSSFMRALNSRAETWRGVSYTNIATRLDETVQPASSPMLTTGRGRITNVFTQDVCPTATSEHLLVGLIDPTAYALAIDALGHDGPADPRRIDPATCQQVLHPGIDPVTGPLGGAAALESYTSYEAAQLFAEPPLACYTRRKRPKRC